MSDQNKSNWRVDKLFRDRLRRMPRGSHGSCMELVLDCDKHLSAHVHEAMVEDMTRHMQGSLLAAPEVQRFLALKKKREKIEADKKAAELSVRKWQAERELLVCSAYEPGQADKLAAIDAQIRSHSHTAGGLGGLLGQLEGELTKAREAAERVLRVHLDREACAARVRYAQRRDELLAEFCSRNADKLDELANAVERFTVACQGGSTLIYSFRSLLDTAELPPDAPESVPPLPPPAPVPTPRPTLPPGVMGIVSADPLPPNPPRRGLGVGEMPPGMRPKASEPTPEPAAPAASAEPPAEPQATEDEPRGKGKRRATAKVE